MYSAGSQYSQSCVTIRHKQTVICYYIHFIFRSALTIILLCHLFSRGLLSGPSSDLDQLLDDFLCGYSAVDGQEGILQSLETTREKVCQQTSSNTV